MRYATNFDKRILPRINEVLEYACNNPCSDFYRKKYANMKVREIKSYDDFQKIPILTKEEILAVPIEKRTFVPQEKIARYRFSSGTVNSEKLLILPVSSFPQNPYRKELLEKLGLKNLYLLMQPLSPQFLYPNHLYGEKIKIIHGDISNLGICAKVARDLKIEGIQSTPTIITLFIDHLKKNKFDLGDIRWITLSGEFCSTKKYEYLKSEFPNAYFDFNYGTMETGGMLGYRCLPLSKSPSPNVFHVRPNFIIEIISNDNKPLSFDNEGELINTSLEINAFPLIRYKSRDAGYFSEYNCPCGNNFTFSLGGRINFDVLKFNGVALYTELISRAIDASGKYFESRFQMHVFENKEQGKIKPNLQLHLKLKKEFEEMKNDYLFKENSARKISTDLRLSMNSTLEQLVKKDIFLPLEIVFVDSWPENKFKNKNIISHLD